MKFLLTTTRVSVALFCAQFAVFCFAQTTTLVTDRGDLAGTDNIEWGTHVGPEFTFVFDGDAITSSNTTQVLFNNSGAADVTLQQGTSVGGNWNLGEIVLSTNEAVNVDNPIAFSFDSIDGVCAFGTQVQTANYGSFDVRIEALDDNSQLIDSAKSVNGMASNDNASGMNPFVGLTSDNPMYSVLITVTSVTPITGDPVAEILGYGAVRGWFMVNQVDFSPCPDGSEVVELEIDIKPGSDPNSVNLCSQGSVPVALLSTNDYDVLDLVTGIDPETITLADASVRTVGKASKLMCNGEDANDDGLDDLVCKIPTVDLNVSLGTTDTTADLNAETFDGLAAEGSDTIRIVKDCE